MAWYYVGGSTGWFVFCFFLSAGATGGRTASDRLVTAYCVVHTSIWRFIGYAVRNSVVQEPKAYQHVCGSRSQANDHVLGIGLSGRCNSLAYAYPGGPCQGLFYGCKGHQHQIKETVRPPENSQRPKSSKKFFDVPTTPTTGWGSHRIQWPTDRSWPAWPGCRAGQRRRCRTR